MNQAYRRVVNQFGYPEWKWEMINESEPNDYGDCLKLCLLVWLTLKHEFEQAAPPKDGKIIELAKETATA